MRWLLGVVWGIRDIYTTLVVVSYGNVSFSSFVCLFVGLSRQVAPRETAQRLSCPQMTIPNSGWECVSIPNGKMPAMVAPKDYIIIHAIIYCHIHHIHWGAGFCQQHSSTVRSTMLNMVFGLASRQTWRDMGWKCLPTFAERKDAHINHQVPSWKTLTSCPSQHALCAAWCSADHLCDGWQFLSSSKKKSVVK